MTKKYVVTHHMAGEGERPGFVTLSDEAEVKILCSAFADEEEAFAAITGLSIYERHTLYVCGSEWLTFQPLSE